MRVRLVLFVSVIALIIAGCSSSESADDATTTTVESTKPEVVVPDGAAPEEVTVEDLAEGDGAEIAEGAYVELKYVGVLYDSGEEFSSRWDDEAFRFVTGTNVALPGLEEGLAGMKVGGQRQIVVPAAEAYGEVERQGIPSDSDLVFLVELTRVFEEPQIENIDEPATELGIEVLIEGDGDEVEEGAQLLVNYVGVAQSTGEEFDSSWARGEPASLGLGQVIEGWQEGMLGQKVGSRIQLTIPGEKAYGEAPPSPAIGANDTLIFVVDILEATTPAIQVPQPGDTPGAGG